MGDYDNGVKTKWNADDTKIQMIMIIESELESAFLSYDYEGIFRVINSYARQTGSKFKEKEEASNFKIIEKELTPIIIKFRKKEAKLEELNKFYQEAQKLFLLISRKLKSAGIYFREGKNASHAILER